MITTQVEQISPTLAFAYLKTNKNNRNVREMVVDAYAREMLAGNWVLQHQGIAFNENGDLVDGQHRLRAIIKSGCTVVMTVTRGLPVNCVTGIDVGAKRHFQDVLQMQYADTVEKELRNTRVVSAVRNLIKHNVNSKINMTPTEVRAVFFEFHDVFSVIDKITNGNRVGLSGEVTGAIASALIAGESVENIQAYSRVFKNADVSDCENLNVAAAINWRRQIDDAKNERKTISRVSLFYGTENSVWNFCHNTDVKTIKIPKALRYDIREKCVKTIQQV